MFVIAVQIIARGILARIGGEAGGIQAGAEPKLCVLGPDIFSDKPAHGQGRRRLITMNAAGKIDSAMRRYRGAMQREQANIVFSFKPVDRPPVGLSCNEAIIKKRLNIDGLAEIAALVKAQRFHSLGRNRLGGLRRLSGIARFLLTTSTTARLSLIELLPIRIQS